MKEGCKNALWFSDLDLMSIVFRTRIFNQPIQLDYATCSSPSNTCSNITSESIYQVLDHFAISDEFYHEMSMLFPFLPRSYTIRSRMANSIAVQHLAQPYLGAYRPLRLCLQEAQVNLNNSNYI